MNEPLDKFLEQIKNTLLHHEETYDEGAWERFAAKNISTGKKPKGMVVPLWKWAAAAAAVLVGAFVLLQYLNHSPQGTKIPTGAGTSIVTTDGAVNALQPNTNNATKDSNAPEQAVILPPQTYPGIHEPIKTHNPTYATIDPLKNTAPQNITDNSTAITPPAVVAVQQPSAPAPQQAAPPAQKTENPFYQNKIITEDVAKTPVQPKDDGRKIAAVINPTVEKHVRRETGNRWQSSVYVSPVFGTQDVNMGYGYQLGYAVTDKIRVSSGIAYTKMSASKNFNTPEPESFGMAALSAAPANANFSARSSAVIVESAPQLQSVDAWLSGIDVPVEVNYDINKKLYAAAGVSVLFVLEGKTREMYPDNNVRITVATPQDKIREDKNVTMHSPNNELPESTSFLGFYNISMGYRQKISKKNSVSLEPFVKVPMKQVTQQKLNYTGVGVRLKFDF